MSELLGFYGMGFALLVHIAFVSITLGVGLITAIYRYIAYSTGESYYEDFARRAFKIMIVSELFSGVWGTIITVFLAGMFPNLLALATNVLFIPILIALVSIMIRIPSIAVFWYTWDRISAKLHTAVGFVMAISGFGVPFGFRAIFSEINYPHAISEYLSTGFASGIAAYMNPVFWILYIHTVFSVVSIGGFVIASLMSHEGDARGAMIGVKFGLLFFVLNFGAGLFYMLFLGHYSPFLYKAVTIGAYAPVFVLKLILIFALLALANFAYASLRDGRIVEEVRYLGLLALVVAVIGELMNGAARYPYMVVIGEKGLPISDFFNYYMDLPIPIVSLILVALIAAIFVFLLAAFYALVRRFLDVPVYQKV